jgi:D-alanine-D-alanine ligase
MAAARLKVGVIFGGRSVEHEVSIVSARSIAKNLDAAKYEAVPIGITREGRWFTSSDPERLFREGPEVGSLTPCTLSPDPAVKGLLVFRPGAPPETIPLDVVFPIVHGGQGEDGTLQGLLEMADLPYVGSGVLGSSMGMDKDVMKRVFHEAGLPIVRSRALLRSAYEADRAAVLKSLPGDLGYPCFVKPANTGSSVGISKAKSAADLESALALAFRYDRKVVVEQGLEAREIECSVLGNDEPVASVPGEIVPSREFYDYEAKYLDEGSQLLIPAPISPQAAEEVRRMALAAYRALDLSGMARVDFFLEKRSGGRIVLNEVNTLPGFTSISMYPKLWEASGVPYPELLARLLALALQRQRDKHRSSSDFRPGSGQPNP